MEPAEQRKISPIRASGNSRFLLFLLLHLQSQLKAYNQVKTELDEQRTKLFRARTRQPPHHRNSSTGKVKAEYAEKGKLFTTEMRTAPTSSFGFKSLSDKVVIIEIVPAAATENA